MGGDNLDSTTPSCGVPEVSAASPKDSTRRLAKTMATATMQTKDERGLM